MAKRKTYAVLFATVRCGETEETTRPLSAWLPQQITRHGPNFPKIDLGEVFQMRDVRRVGRVCMGTFCILRDDAPHLLKGRTDQEEPIPMEADDGLIDKVHFVYHESTEHLVWQQNRGVASLAKLERYLSQLLGVYTAVGQVMNMADLDSVLRQPLRELSFAFARPDNHLIQGGPRWAKSILGLMSDMHAAYGTFMLRSESGDRLSTKAAEAARTFATGQQTPRVKVKLTDESDPIELFLCPLKDEIRVELVGRYPRSTEVFEELEAAYDRKLNALRDY